jgi:hypothetical protein
VTAGRICGGRETECAGRREENLAGVDAAFLIWPFTSPSAAAFADSTLTIWAEFVRKPEILTTTVQELTGTPARSFGQWAADHADDFR